MGRDFQRLSIASGQEIQSASFFFLLVFFFLPVVIRLFQSLVSASRPGAEESRSEKEGEEDRKKDWQERKKWEKENPRPFILNFDSPDGSYWLRLPLLSSDKEIDNM